MGLDHTWGLRVLREWRPALLSHHTKGTPLPDMAMGLVNLEEHLSDLNLVDAYITYLEAHQLLIFTVFSYNVARLEGRESLDQLMANYLKATEERDAAYVELTVLKKLMGADNPMLHFSPTLFFINDNQFIAT